MAIFTDPFSASFICTSPDSICLNAFPLSDVKFSVRSPLAAIEPPMVTGSVTAEICD
ncbi:hypothetical protein HH214_10505 [Mucilaginibacter robiniae]|uniref:Uncharacterized protein n=1 Tax=Mucilaginibacter robiniae TaxID=2728022 RepID=A0A7L5E3M1_9SPHI|nr:hypothetical protein [Mucilaginibacter robiniae]QJD96264.1 hypothetical protein HH214_10505 [Mucilaginibacter robiniae]